MPGDNNARFQQGLDKVRMWGLKSRWHVAFRLRTDQRSGPSFPWIGGRQVLQQELVSEVQDVTYSDLVPLLERKKPSLGTKSWMGEVSGLDDPDMMVEASSEHVPTHASSRQFQLRPYA